MSPPLRVPEETSALRSASSRDGGSEAETRSIAALNLAATIRDAMQNGEPALLSEDALQALMEVLCRAYAAQRESQDDVRPLPQGSSVSPTEVMLMTRGLLQAVGLTSFEYAFWQSWAGN
jgi:hypothetical protein